MTTSPDTTQRGDARVALEVEGLTVVGRPSDVEIIHDVTLRVARGDILGLVGESGSGKTTLGLALLAHCKRATEITAGRIALSGSVLDPADAAAVRRMRGRRVAYIPQSPASALNPALTLGTQLREALHDSGVAADGGDGAGGPGAGAAPTARERAVSGDPEARVREVLREVALPDDDAFLRRYPHQLSGGQQQRVAIAMAFIGCPDLIVLDEPTTGLDVTTQAHVLQTIRHMTREYGTAGVYISHDMAVVADLADEIAVMYSGEVVERGPADRLLGDPQHPYTVQLLRAVPLLKTAGHTAPAPAAEEDVLLRVRGLRAGYGRTTVLSGIDLDLARGQCVALLGESGSGKTTLSRSLVGLHHQFTGEVVFDGAPLAPSSYRRTAEQRRRVQYIFQNPYEALNPRKRVRDLILRPYTHLAGRPKDPDAVVATALERAALPASYGERFPDQLSGGERQRVSIARAIATRPDLLICDEITSALDVSVQAEIVELLRNLQDDGMALLFVTHNIALVSNIAQHVAVLNKGEIVEYGDVGTVMSAPAHAYTQALIADTPDFELSFGESPLHRPATGSAPRTD
ncbi:ABC transporter ATP-binding protein [Streptomonospora nanhaiensis]|uniref:Peptide/nickel transport system ATP-binding protein n=1 Tax=Streptomonospora nanhaiensis TaxID=1323731 RepID=A0A853BSL4_9ACTN|nr:ABC transporter ATP-binding protein [Streptomonospora nanhaiensis]MBX9390339.1 ABC transporter ATP-binding protein [Streptomonospora nanhaiensis]NYI98133.1 peptide/nickel transport system ATP-binding protein [Streptomonospora nanhaiensis]